MTREEAIKVLQTALTSPLIYGEYADAINMAIEALSDHSGEVAEMVKKDLTRLKVNVQDANNVHNLHSGDLISRADAIETVQQYLDILIGSRRHGDDFTFINTLTEVRNAISALPSAEADWIPIRWHDITDEEREREGYPKEWVVHIDCDMPNDGDEILVQTKSGYIRWDVCYADGELSLDSGWDWIDDIAAWIPLPKPYREDGEA